MTQQQQGRQEWAEQGGAAEAAEMSGTNEFADGMATTQEQVSDMYKMGTIEDRGNRQ
ncbi:DUF4025 domain-containing protein [Brevibacillus choshinensis]|uniref:DUF4025 domain-containing protein n=1 Tax=Brevibacillus choshinensis TaxID=54911 RepID=A0ABX7FHB0_BRECH|nr:DUF4025 domain-containing protein [Brevibacillus choshinensis]QRG65596.1 DUF4025 domain-containing protein [Brevibacillus choshinensis]